MDATFEAAGFIKIDDRRCAIYGSIQSGEISGGQSVAVPLNDAMSITLQFDTLEYLDRIGDKVSHVALTFHKLDNETVELLESLNIGNEILKITDLQP